MERRCQDDGLIEADQSFLAVIAHHDSCAGWVSWRPGPGRQWEVGTALFADFGGRGIGTEAEHQLVRNLFHVTPESR